jgi:WD40 repeat protein/Tfp pilus assembly protein PilN
MITEKSGNNQDNSTELLPDDEKKGELKSISNYKLLEVIGEGGMGVVYLAQQDKPIRRKVALKVIKPGMDSKEVIARFESERQALALMNHPNIAQVYDAGETVQGYPYFVMEYVPGLPITEYCDKYKLSTKERLKLFQKVCDAVQHAHYKGIVHRDLKPSNILVMFQNEKHVPKTIDFGIAKALTGPGLTEKTLHTKMGMALGTPVYMSPEQAELTGYDIDTRTDVYSLGAILYELLVGVTPFDWKDLKKAGMMEMMRIIREVEPPRPSTRFNSLGDTSTEIAKKRGTTQPAMTKLLRGDIDWIVMKALEKDRRRRYSTAGDFTADINRYLVKEPIQARPPSIVYKIRKSIQKHKAATFTIFFILCLILIFSLWNLKERQKALSEKLKAEASSEEALFQLARNHWDNSRQAREKNEMLYALHLHAEAVRVNPNLEFRKILLIDMNDLWNYFPLVHIFRHQDEVNGAIFNSDGIRILTWSWDNNARIWDAQSGKPIGQPVEHEQGVIGATFNAQETRILTWSADNTARIWEAQTGKPIGQPMVHKGQVLGAKFNADETWILTWSIDGTARIWDTQTGKPIGQSMVHKSEILGAKLNANDTRILTWGIDGTVRIWDAQTRKSIGQPIVHNKGVLGATFNTRGTRILTWSIDGTARIWDAQNGKPIGQPMVHQSKPIGQPMVQDSLVYGATISADDTRILTWSWDQTARIWDAENGESIGLPMVHKRQVLGAKFNADETWILTWSADHTARIWDAENGKPIGEPMVHKSIIWGATIIADDTQILTWSDDNTVRIWDAQNGKPIGQPIVHNKWLKGATTNSDGTLILTWCDDNTVRIWDAKNIKTFGQPIVHEKLVKGATFIEGGIQIRTWSWDGTARIWDAQNGRLIEQPMVHKKEVLEETFQADGTRILKWSADGTVRICDAQNGRPIGQPMVHKGRVYGATFNSDESWILTWSEDGTARIWDALTRKPIGPPMVHNESVTEAAFNTQETRILTQSKDGTAKLWDTGVDVDFPTDKIKLQILALTGTELDAETRQVKFIQLEEWEKVKKEYMDFAREHYRKCKYPYANVFRRLFPEEAEKVRKLEAGNKEIKKTEITNEYYLKILNDLSVRRAKLKYVGDTLARFERVTHLLDRKVARISELYRNREISSKIINGISKVLPKNILLTELHLTGSTFRLVGSSPSQKSIQDFIINLQKLKLLTNIEQTSHIIKKPNGQKMFNFNINSEIILLRSGIEQPKKKLSKIKKVSPRTLNREYTIGLKQLKEVLSKIEADIPRASTRKSIAIDIRGMEYIKREIEALEKKKNKLELIQSDLESRIRVLEKLDDILPEKIDIKKIQYEIQTRISAAKLKTINISPGIEKKNRDYNYNEIAFKIKIGGDYQNLSFFFDQISKVRRLFKVNQFYIRIFGGTLKTSKLEANLTLLTFGDNYPTLKKLKDIQK